MQPLTPEAQQALHDLAQRYGVSLDAATTLLFAVSLGGGTMAQFNIPELGGSGQWMQGGMTMVGDMFNYGLQAKVSGLCGDLSQLLRSQPVFVPLPPVSGATNYAGYTGNFWPAELGQPSSSGGQNDSRYAYFPHVNRLAIDRGGVVTIYDTLNHNIGGVQQQQGGASGTLSFSSQFGTFTVDSLPIAGGSAPPPSYAPPPPPSYAPPPPPPSYAPPPPSYAVTSSPSLPPQTQQEVLSALERLGDLYQKGVLTDSEFQSKKSELLARL